MNILIGTVEIGFGKAASETINGLVQGFEYPAGQLLINTRYPGQLFNAGFAHTLDTTKMCQQCPAPAGPNTRYIFQNRMYRGLLTSAAMAADGKAMGFIPDLLDKVRSA
jgi:hypothetical protein